MLSFTQLHLVCSSCSSPRPTPPPTPQRTDAIVDFSKQPHYELGALAYVCQ